MTDANGWGFVLFLLAVGVMVGIKYRKELVQWVKNKMTGVK